jgi:hypothetical protein
LWGRFNALFAVLLCVAIYYFYFVKNGKGLFADLKTHPFAVAAHFKKSVVLTFAVPKNELAHLIPPCCTLDTYNDEYAFVAIAMVQTQGLRPKGFPAFMGNNFFLIGYRIFVRYTNNAGKNLRGLYILQSQTDKKKMEYLGNLFTHYQYTTTDISDVMQANTNTIKSEAAAFQISYSKDKEEINLPQGSPFPDWKTARRYAGPLPFTFTYNKQQQEVLVIEGVRSNWTPRPIQIEQYQFNFFKERNINNAVLANAFIIEDIPYYWKKGKVEPWQQ